MMDFGLARMLICGTIEWLVVTLSASEGSESRNAKAKCQNAK
jgi:hypothetical protein